MPWLFFYASLSIPFYGVGMLFGPKSHFAVIDFWRFWVVHLWVEDLLEIFTTVNRRWNPAAGLSRSSDGREQE
jgi:nitric oxide reductase subunit B